MFGFLVEWLTWAFTVGGLWGFFGIVTLENFIVPIPSELVLPFAGYLVYTGQFSLTAAIVVSVLGSVAGSLMSYALGRYGGVAFVHRFGHWFLLHPHDLVKAHRWFDKHGSLAVFICRFLPGVRQISSIPAGAARMPLGRFIFWTAVGSLLWNASLIYLGYKLGPAWLHVADYTKFLEVIVVVAFIAFAVYWWHRHGRELLAEWRTSRASKDVQKPTKRAQSKRGKKR